jgi:hypothetical protein
MIAFQGVVGRPEDFLLSKSGLTVAYQISFARSVMRTVMNWRFSECCRLFIPFLRELKNREGSPYIPLWLNGMGLASY